MLTGATTQANASAPVVDEFSGYTACSRDDKYNILQNGTMTIDDGTAVCRPTTAATAHWQLNGSTLLFDTDTFTVKSFDCKTMVLVTSYRPGQIDTKYFTRQ